MLWSWQHPNWPHFEFDTSKWQHYERTFYQNSGRIVGSIQHLENTEQDLLKVEILSQEAVSTSSIEGEILNRESVQSSISKHLGLKTERIHVPPNAAGVAEMMVQVYLKFDEPLSHNVLFEWHQMLMNGRRDLEMVGAYRRHVEPMQIVSGNLAAPKLFYEAPPSEQMMPQMEAYINWFNSQSISQNSNISTLAFAAIAHLYFEMIHPFEDGNGRIGRALIEKAISRRLGYPSLNSFAKVIETNKKAYYEALQACNHRLEVDNYLGYFSKIALEAQHYTLKTIDFIIFKNKLFAQHRFNQRQEKVLLRVFKAGIEGFYGGLSAKNYQTISGASPATTTRDLQELVSQGVLIKKGELKHSRYYLPINYPS